LKNTDSNEKLVEILSIRKFDNTDSVEIRPEFENMLQTTTKKSEKNHSITKNVTYQKNQNVGQIKVNNEDVVLSEKLTNILSKKRADDYHEWIRIGWCLFNIGEYNLLNSYKSFSKKSNKYEEGCCEKIFESANVCGGYTIATLKWLAKQDNVVEYNRIIIEHISEHLKNAISLTDNDIARYVYEKYKHVIKRTPHEDWYVFQDGKWIENRKGHLVRNMISEDVVKDVLTLRQSYDEIAKTKTGDEQDFYLKKANCLTKLILKIKTRTTKKNIIEEAGDLFTDNNFLNSLDSQINLIGFNNGVYDLDRGIFRETVPDDRVTKTVGYDYIEIGENHKDYKDLEKYFSQVFVDKELKHFTLKYISSFLDGTIRDQKYVLWTGVGANGKSTTVSLIRDTFGDYYMPVPVTLFTRKQGSASNASPELMALKGIRVGCMQEPDHGDKMNVGRMKEISGGDQIVGRALFKEMEKFKPQCKIFMTCNDLPPIEAMDGGTWRRLIVILFGSEFVNPDDIKYKNQFPKDQNLEYSIGKWKNAFMTMLLKYYKLYRSEGLIEPESVKLHTRKYKKKNDICEEFVDACVVVTGNSTNTESTDVIYEYFKNWFSSCVPGRRCPKKIDFIDQLEKKHFKIKGNTIFNVIVKSSNDAQQHEKHD
jgi:P4 family phage/plasmid primase-like protien